MKILPVLFLVAFFVGTMPASAEDPCDTQWGQHKAQFDANYDWNESPMSNETCDALYDLLYTWDMEGQCQYPTGYGWYNGAFQNNCMVGPGYYQKLEIEQEKLKS